MSAPSYLLRGLAQCRGIRAKLYTGTSRCVASLSVSTPLQYGAGIIRSHLVTYSCRSLILCCRGLYAKQLRGISTT